MLLLFADRTTIVVEIEAMRVEAAVGDTTGEMITTREEIEGEGDPIHQTSLTTTKTADTTVTAEMVRIGS